jgi:hypothetical protein
VTSQDIKYQCKKVSGLNGRVKAIEGSYHQEKTMKETYKVIAGKAILLK